MAKTNEPKWDRLRAFLGRQSDAMVDHVEDIEYAAGSFDAYQNVLRMMDGFDHAEKQSQPIVQPYKTVLP